MPAWKNDGDRNIHCKSIHSWASERDGKKPFKIWFRSSKFKRVGTVYKYECMKFLILIYYFRCKREKTALVLCNSHMASSLLSVLVFNQVYMLHIFLSLCLSFSHSLWIHCRCLSFTKLYGLCVLFFFLFFLVWANLILVGNYFCFNFQFPFKTCTHKDVYYS